MAFQKGGSLQSTSNWEDTAQHNSHTVVKAHYGVICSLPNEACGCQSTPPPPTDCQQAQPQPAVLGNPQITTKQAEHVTVVESITVNRIIQHYLLSTPPVWCHHLWCGLWVCACSTAPPLDRTWGDTDNQILGQHTHIALVKHLFKDSFKKGSRHRDQSINHKQCHSLMIHRIGRHLSHAARVVTAVTHRHARWLIKAMRAQYTSTEHYTVTTKHVGICTYGHIGQRWGHLLHSSYVNLSTTANWCGKIV